MAQTGYTPIQLYRTTTAAAVPLTANLNPGELAININDADMALYAENASGTVKRLMNNPAGLKYPTADGTNGQVIKTDGAGVLSWTAGASGSYLALSGGVMTGAITFNVGQTVANLASGSAGTIPYQSAAGTTAMLSAGTSGQVLTSGGAGAPTWSTASGLTLGTPVATTSGTSIDFTGIPAGTKQIDILLYNVSTNGSSSLIVQLGDAGGFETSGYSGTVCTINDASSPAFSGSAGDGCPFSSSSINAAVAYLGKMTLTLENSTANRWLYTSRLVPPNPGPLVLVSGIKELSQTLSQLRLTTSSGNTFDGGEINIIYS